MEGKQLTSEELANKAIEFLELAGKLEDEEKIEEALESYEKALAFLIESGYLPHRIDDIRSHIDQLTQKVDKTEISKRELKKVETNKLQDEAFLLLDQAKKAELDGDFQKAIKRYDSAISMLRES
ncbi:MAG: hypothetical protein GF311_24215, partial [Candidatus Lokiarchaeota archaeon]|nr:hypothetical protein [Candidatus Lokiarchaeota archaeon]